MPSLYRELSLGAQTAYAEVVDQVGALDLHSLAPLTGFFQRREIKGHEYVYFGYRDPLGDVQRRAYVGPADARVNALVAKFAEEKAPKKFAPNAQAAIALGCTSTLPKHFNIVRQLGAYGFFRAGGVLIGTHAFVAMANMLGVRRQSGERTLDVDLAHAGRSVSVALPANTSLSVHDALTSLELGLLPTQELSGKSGAQYRNPKDPELRVDFVTTMTRDGRPVRMNELGLVLEPLKFLEFILEGTTQAALLSRDGACLVNIPSPARFAVHKLIVAGERKVKEAAKARKDLEQVAMLAEWHLETRQRTAEFNKAFRAAFAHGPGWRTRLNAGKRIVVDRHPFLASNALWRTS